MSKPKEKRGRPPKPRGEARTVAMTIRLTPAEHAALRELANGDSRSLADCLIVRVLGRRL